MERVAAALGTGSPLLILGPPGVGKSRLIDEVCAPTRAGAPIRMRFVSQPHAFFAALAITLANHGHEVMKTRLDGTRAAAIRRLSSLQLRGMLWKALAAEPRSLILEDVQPASAPLYRFLQPVRHFRGMSLIATAHDRSELGFLNRVLWDPRNELILRPLTQYESNDLADAAETHFSLPCDVNRAELRGEILAACGGNPGRIIETYRLASHPQYQANGRIKLGLIQIDLAARFTA